MNQVTSHHSVANAAPPSSAALTEFAAQYREVYRRLTLVAAGMVGDRVFAEDLVQEAAVIGLQKFHRFEPNTNFGAWMAENRPSLLPEFMSARSAIERRTRPTLTSWSIPTKHRPAGRRPSSTVPNQVRWRIEGISTTMSWLLCKRSTKSPAVVVLLRIVERVSYREIAELLGDPPRDGNESRTPRQGAYA